MVCWTIPPLSSPSYPFIGWSSIYRWCPVRFPSYEPKKTLNLDNLMVINWYVVLDWCSYNHGGKKPLYIRLVCSGDTSIFFDVPWDFPESQVLRRLLGYADRAEAKASTTATPPAAKRTKATGFGRRRWFGENDGKFAMVWGRLFLGYPIVRQTIPNSRDAMIIFSAMSRAPQLFYWCM